MRRGLIRSTVKHVKDYRVRTSLKFYYTFKRCVIIMSTERGRDTERYMKRETRERRVSVRTRGHV